MEPSKLTAEVELARLKDTFADYKESFKECELRMKRAETRAGGHAIARQIAEDHCKRISLERNELRKQINRLLLNATTAPIMVFNILMMILSIILVLLNKYVS